MDFEFKTFSTRSFERFSQAMALHVLGNGVLVYGDGPDGAREATYDGQLNYPSDAENWNGYTVMQAKFLQVPGTPQEDADWLVGQLRAELNKFTKPNSDLRKPNFYILVTNARLSPMPAGERGKGGIAKIDEVFAEYKVQLGLNDFRVWHLDQLSTMLMTADKLRRSYAAWLSSSDVIADILGNMHSRSESVQEAMYRYLARELRSHQPIRLQQAGHSGSSQTMIEDVFTDLPYVFAQQRGDVSSNNLLLASLLECSRDCLDGASVTAQQEREIGRPERILLLGGPGQGKSTLSQFLAQIFRANMLHSERGGKYPAEIGRIVRSTLSKAKAANICVDVPRRFPLRIDLPSFADWLSRSSSGDEVSLLHYVAKHVATVADAEIGIEDLRHWLTTYPTILILDGLDEVPSSANRSSVLRAINEFWDEAVQADLLMIVTTRPQGYNDDLDPVYYSKFEMTPLAPEQALSYARNLAGALIIDPLQRDRVLERLAEAAESKTTARLLVSPLQVAILLALIDQRGDAPTDRWSLFDKYFAVMLQREQGKAGSVGQTMRHWSRQISAIHYKAGFLLHVEAETQGHSETHLSSIELESLVRGQLADEGFEGDELQSNTRELLEVSTERMVLLVQRAEDRFSFEVRSLQEFMAAAYIMSGRDTVVQNRLSTIANRTHWLHVFQIAASKCFAVNDSEQYRDTIVTICRDINENGEEMDRLLRTGSGLALALLDDGLAYDQPKYRRLLVSTAFDILSAGPYLFPGSLCEHCERDPVRTIELFRKYISSRHTDTADAAWKLYFSCSAKGQAWTEDLLDEIWSDDPDVIAKLFFNGVLLPSESKLLLKMTQALEDMPFKPIRRAFDYYRGSNSALRNRALSKNYPSLTLLTQSRIGRQSIKLKVGGKDSQFSLAYLSVTMTDESRKIYDSFPNSPAWAPQNGLKEFCENPNASSLADLIASIETNGWQEIFMCMSLRLPWPCASLFYMGVLDNSLMELSEKIRAGDFGDYADWRAAEERWSAKGVDEEDFNCAPEGKFFDSNIAARGWPWSIFSYSPEENIKNLCEPFLPIASSAQGVPRAKLIELIDVAFDFEVDTTEMQLDTALLLVEKRFDMGAGNFWLDPLMVNRFPPDLMREESLLNKLEKISGAGCVYLTTHTLHLSALYDLLLSNFDKRPGLFVLFANLIAGDRSNFKFDRFDQISRLVPMREVDALIEGILCVLKFVVGATDAKTIEPILRKAKIEEQFLPSFLLRQFLEDERLEHERGREIAEEISSFINKNPSISHGMYISEIKQLSDVRRAELHKPTCWKKLEFGDTLLVLSSQRRSVRSENVG